MYALAAWAVMGLGADRPVDVWVFRSVLDKRPRMVTAMMGDGVWLAYDATNCGFYKLWRGDVKFEGSVYTGEHGPQPLSVGDTLLTGVPDQSVWRYTLPKGQVKPRWRGYRLGKNKTLTLQYEFPYEKGKSTWVYETPTFQDGILKRRFEVKNLPAGADLSLDLGDGRTQRLRAGQSDLAMPIVKAESQENWFASTEPANLAQDPEQEGLAMRLYYIGEGLSQIPALVPGQSPNYNTVISTVNFSTKEHFGGFDEQFFVEITGTLVVDRPGRYDFRLTSDDGSRLTIGQTLVVDHDGLHSAEGREGGIDLTSGRHALKLEFFENEADNVLKLEWKRPGGEWELLPASATRTPRGEVKVTAPGKKRVLDLNRRNRPGDARPLTSVHPSYTLATVRPATFRPKVGGIDFMPDGRMVVCNWEPEGGVYVLSGVQAPNPNNIRVQRFAFGMAEPLGVKVVRGQVYVLQKQELTQLIDHDGDGVADEYRCIADGWGVTPNFHEFAFGLVYRDRHFYANLAIAINPGGASTQPQNRDRGRVIRIAEDGSYEFVAHGLRTPNGIGFGPDQEIFLSDNQGDWLPSSKILHLSRGAFFGSRAVDPVGDKDRPEKPPVVWLPQGEIGNSPGNPTLVPNGPFKGQLMHGDVTHGGVKRVFLEKVNGQYQGCVFRFTQGLEGGINRILFGPDGALYVGGIGSGGNWGQEGKERFGLQRLTYNGRPTFEMLAVRAKANGMELEFTQPLAAGVGETTEDYTMRRWRYVPTVQYGGPKVDDTALIVKSVTVSKDRKRVFLETSELKAGHVIYVRLGRGIASAQGQLAWSTEGWYTLNQIPSARGQVAPAVKPINALTAEEKAQGFQLLFDGKSFNGWAGYYGQMGPGWSVQDGMITFTPGKGGGGDIMTTADYADFELRLEWRVAPGGNSGIFYRSAPGRNSAWDTGPEMQVLDDDRHSDGQNPLTSAGSLYALIARNPDVARPADRWNEVRIIAKGTKIEHWLNGVRIVSYDTSSAEFKSLVAKSKFRDLPQFAKMPTGRIVLQDHGDLVQYRNLRIRKL